MEKDVTKPVNNRLSVPAEFFLDWLSAVVYVSPFLDFRVYPTRIRDEIFEQRKVYIFAIPNKGHSDEDASLEIMELMVTFLNKLSFPFDCLLRNTPNGDRVDGVRIWV